jgi:hypothetical protein
MEADLTNHDKLPPNSDKPKDLTPDPTETDALVEVPVEGPIPGMPIATDPLLNPSPRPQKREVPPLD